MREAGFEAQQIARDLNKELESIRPRLRPQVSEADLLIQG